MENSVINTVKIKNTQELYSNLCDELWDLEKELKNDKYWNKTYNEEYDRYESTQNEAGIILQAKVAELDYKIFCMEGK